MEKEESKNNWSDKLLNVCRKNFSYVSIFILTNNITMNIPHILGLIYFAFIFKFSVSSSFSP